VRLESAPTGVRDRGRWKGKQIIKERSIKNTTHAHQPIPNFSFAKASKSQTLIPQNTFYGGFWHRERLKTKTLDENLLFASGNGGQYIFIVKRLYLVVVFTQVNYGLGKRRRLSPFWGLSFCRRFICLFRVKQCNRKL
jgi:CubicO group peptidase (beta-lactamase class C family)